MRARHISIAVIGVVTLAAVGCGSDDNDSSDNSGGGSSSKQTSPSTSGGGSSAVKLDASEFKFSPANPSVKKGEVTFTVANKGQVVHALEVEGPGEEQETGAIQPGKTKTLKVDLNKDGTFEFYCPIDGHKQQGMVGKVKVGKGGGSASSSSDDDSGGGSGGGY